MAYNNKDQSSVTVTIDGADAGLWEKKSGGEIDSDESTIYPGGGQKPVQNGGKQVPGQITLSRSVDLDRDWPVIKGWMARAGKGLVAVKDQPLDADDVAYGEPLVQKGKLKTVTPPDRDSSDSTAAEVSIVVSTDGNVG